MSADRSAARFHLGLALIGGLYVALIVALLVADLASISPAHLARALASREIRAALWLSLISCSITAILSVWVGVPLGYLLARVPFPGRGLVAFLLDVPIVLPPLVVGLSLLVLFQTPPGLAVQRLVPVTYHVPAVILAQFAVAAAFAARTMRVTFERTDPRAERVALTLGCSPAQAFWRVALPEAWPGVMSAFTLAWARSLGEFGPVLIFAGTTRMKTEVLPTTVYLELSVGNVEAALAVSALMIGVAAAVLVVSWTFGLRDS